MGRLARVKKGGGGGVVGGGGGGERRGLSWKRPCRYGYNSPQFNQYCTGIRFLGLSELFSFIFSPIFFSFCRILEARVKLKFS